LCVPYFSRKPFWESGRRAVSICPRADAHVDKECETLEKATFQSHESIAFGVFGRLSWLKNSQQDHGEPILWRRPVLDAVIEELQELVVGDRLNLKVQYVVYPMSALRAPIT
jgi:hypothetical protein